MARLLSRTLLRQTLAATANNTFSAAPKTPFAFLNHRGISNRSRGNGSLIEIILEPDSSEDALNNSHGNNGDEKRGVRIMSEIVNRIMIKRSEPDWLPFVPGASYWVPPVKATSGTLGQLLGGKSGGFSCPVSVLMEDSSIDSTEVEVQEPLNADLSNKSKPEEEK